MQNKKRIKSIKRIFYSMLIIFILLLISFFFTSFRRELFMIAAAFALIFLILGIILSIVVWRSRLKKKTPLLLAGLSAPGILLGTILHNLLYAIATITQGITSQIFEFLHGAFFLISLIICPLLFIIGSVWSLIAIHRK